MISLPYGDSQIDFEIPSYFSQQPEWILPAKQESTCYFEQSEIRVLINKYIFTKPIPADAKVAIAVNDATRPIPNATILPPLIKYLHDLGISDENICFIIATGTHRAPTEEELGRILPISIREKYRTLVHVCDDQNYLVFLGVSHAGTPIYINAAFYEADIKIVTGHIEPHHFMGFSGGVKSAVIGLGGRETITANHRMLLNPAANLGSFKTNPMRMDIEDIGRIIDIDFALNVVLDDEKRIINVFFGTPAEVIEKGVAYSRKACLVDAPANYDLVICSAGGFPKDINLYQAQKAITHAGGLLRDGGAIILTAECRTGFGSKPFQQFIEANLTAEKIIHEFQNMPFAIGPHKAYQLAVQARDFRLLLVSTIALNPGLHSLLDQTASVKEALEICTTFLSPSARIAILPFATHVIHHFENRS